VDEFTLERYPHGLPSRELRMKPGPPPRLRPRWDDPPEVIAERRRVLCDDVPTWIGAHRRLADAIRRLAA
jgi:hypothetical protein